MEKSFVTRILMVASLFVFTGGVTFAQGQPSNLPSAGLTPESPFYFIDKLGEALREFFAFNPEGKARLQITFAAERVAEIKIILETKGVEARGLEVAQARLQEHLGDAAEIVIKEKGKGKDVSKLAKELDDDFDEAQSALEQSFKERERALEAREEQVEQELREARRDGDTAKVGALTTELAQIEAEQELLEQKEEELEDALEAEEEKIEEEMEAKEEAEKALKEAEEERQEILDEAAEEGLAIPAGVFGKFDSLLAQAKSALAAGNFAETKRLAKQAEKSLDVVEEIIEKLEETKEEELKEEQEQEAREEVEERKKEDAEEEAERLEGNED